MESDLESEVQGIVSRFSLFWLACANGVGLWLSILLILPEAGNVAGSLTYGRWMPLHMDWHLYGWCSLPLVGLLFRYMLVDVPGALKDVRASLFVWSLALGLLGIVCLSGTSSGKLFLDWAGGARIAFPAAQVFLWTVVASHFVKRLRLAKGWNHDLFLRALVLMGLLASPVALFVTSGADVYPPIDPESGGATGQSLLASSLGIVILFAVMPAVLKVPLRVEGSWIRRFYWVALILSGLGWLVLDHGNASNTQPGQIMGLGILLGWVPLVWLYFKSFEWTSSSRWWCLSFLGWWMFLTINGFVAFLPPVLEIAKFTNAMVAHAHLAMAGMMTSLNMLILSCLGKEDADAAWSDPVSFVLWHLGTVVYVIIMTLQGVREGMDPFVLYGSDALTNLTYSIRLLAGILMLIASLRWLSHAFKR